MYDHAEARSLVAVLYQAVLGRDPDPEGQEYYVEELVSGRRTVTQIVRDFADSPEYPQARRNFNPQLTQFKRFPDTEILVSPEIIDQLFEKTSCYWRNTASAPHEIYWSVITEEKWSRELSDEDRVQFVSTGEEYANRVLNRYKKYSKRSIADITCIDFGCGVGRLAINFASRVGQVHAVDFSESHLQELQRNAVMFQCESKITVWPIRKPADLDQLPQVDLVYSFIVLQHNTPPVISSMMSALLDHLQPGGYAFLHVTLAGSGYEGFSVNDYLASAEAGTKMEAHILPRSNINALAARAGCVIRMSHCVGGNDHQYSEEIVFHKPLTSD